MSLRQVDANLLIALHALLRERNVTRAAKSVGLGQSAMSHALARLRAQLGDPLLVPSGRILVPTPRARALVVPVERAVANLEAVFAAPARFLPATSERTFQIAGTDNLALYLLPKLVSLLAREAPAVKVRYHSLPKDWAGPLRRGEIDVKLGRAYPVADDLRSEQLLVEKFVCVVRKDHPVARAGSRLSIEQYAALDHVVVAPTLAIGEPLSSAVDTLLAKRGLTRRIAVSVPAFVLAPFLVASSDLVLTASERLLATCARGLALRKLPLPLRLRSYALSQVWAAHAEHDDGLTWLREAISRALR